MMQQYQPRPSPRLAVDSPHGARYLTVASVRKYLGILSVLLVAGCHSGDTPRTREMLQEEIAEVPANWEIGSPDENNAPVEEGWWASWTSPELHALFQQVENHNPSLEAAFARMEAVFARSGIEKAEGIPTLSAYGNAGRQRANPTGFQASTTNRFSVGLQLQWEVDVWGRLRNLRSAAQQDAEAAENDYRAARLSLFAETARIWFSWLEGAARLQQVRTQATSLEQQATRLRTLYARGMAQAFDTTSLEAQAYTARAAIEVLQARQDSLGRQLRLLLGEYPEQWQTNTELSAIPLPKPIPSGLPSDLLRRRPDLLTMENNLQALELRWKAARALRYPSFSLTASGGVSSNQLETLTDGPNAVWSLLGNLSAPIFQAGRIDSGIQQAEATYRSTASQYTALLLSAFREVETALANEHFLRLELSFRQEASRQAALAEEQAWQRYERGTVEISAALVAQSRAAETEAALLGVILNLHLNRIALLLALGGDPLAPSIS